MYASSSKKVIFLCLLRCVLQNFVYFTDSLNYSSSVHFKLCCQYFFLKIMLVHFEKTSTIELISCVITLSIRVLIFIENYPYVDSIGELVVEEFRAM